MVDLTTEDASRNVCASSSMGSYLQSVRGVESLPTSPTRYRYDLVINLTGFLRLFAMGIWGALFQQQSMKISFSWGQMTHTIVIQAADTMYSSRLFTIVPASHSFLPTVRIDCNSLP